MAAASVDRGAGRGPGRPQVNRPVADLQRMSDENLAASLCLFARHARAGAVVEEDRAVLFAGAHAYPGAYTNGAIQVGAGLEPGELLARGERFFAPRRRGYAIWVRAHADRDLEARARAAGMFLRPPEAGMPALVRERRIDPPEPVPGVEFVEIGDLPTAREYVMIVAEAYGLEGISWGLAAAMFFDPSCLLAANVRGFLAYLDGRPAAGAMTIVTGHTAGQYWAATVGRARGRGLAPACFRLAVNAGFDLGAEVASLQSSAAGEKLWRSLGFDEVTRYRRYLASARPRQPGGAPERA